MSVHIKIKKGANIKLKGVAEMVMNSAPLPETVAIKPTDFHGLVPKLIVKQGDEVKVGSPLFYDKKNEKIKFTSPVSGEVVEIKRGEKRKILEVKILADKEISYLDFNTSGGKDLQREKIIELLLESGLWAFVRQRPYDVIANPLDIPKSIFISAFSTSPLAPDYDFIVHGQAEAFQAGLDIIAKLTKGKVHLNINAEEKPSGVFRNSKNVQINKFSGPHPAGNVGVQIHHIDPLNKGEKIWYVTPQDVLAIGNFFKNGKIDSSRVIALCGSEVKRPKYYKTIIGAGIKNIIADNVSQGNVRYISGNPLTGTRITPDSYLGYYHDQITVLPEGDEPQFMGWLAPNFDKLSFSRTFFSWLNPAKEYVLNTNLNGEHRAFVVTGQYEDLLPMDIYPVHLIKAIMTNDIDQMEALGIYEVAPEDFALCEFSCTSKMDLQQIIRNGLDVVREELG